MNQRNRHKTNKRCIHCRAPLYWDRIQDWYICDGVFDLKRENCQVVTEQEIQDKRLYGAEPVLLHD